MTVMDCILFVIFAMMFVMLCYLYYSMSADVRVKIKYLFDPMIAYPPQYATTGSAGMDIRSPYDMILPPQSTRCINVAWAIELPPGYEAQIRSRSGLARDGIVVANSPGTVDSDYRGEVGVLLFNRGSLPCNIKKGDKIAQMVIAPVCKAVLEKVSKLSKTQRGAGGWGSTGR